MTIYKKRFILIYNKKNKNKRRGHIAPDIAFPNLGIQFQNVSRVAFTLPFGNLAIYWYAIFVSSGFFFGTWFALTKAELNGITRDLFLNFMMIAGPVAVLLTRMYFVLFNLDMYRGNWVSIFAFRDGGMGVYGGIIGAFISCFGFSLYQAKVKKRGTTTEMMGRIGDTGSVGLLLGQILGRMGNFTNQEAFGGYTDNLFAMQLKVSNIPDRSLITEEMWQNANIINGVQVVQVHPAFLYEIMLNAAIMAFLLWYRRHKKFFGEQLLFYAAAYSFGRFFIERLRTDPLYFWGTSIPASMVTAAVMFSVATTLIIINRIRVRKKHA